jgi:hypothetical protein
MKTLKKGTILKNTHPFFMEDVIVEKNNATGWGVPFANVILTFRTPQPVGTLSIGFEGFKKRALLNKTTLCVHTYVNDKWISIQLTK